MRGNNIGWSLFPVGVRLVFMNLVKAATRLSWGMHLGQEGKCLHLETGGG